ncbi:DUF5602 domain-containing protein [Hymenobacter rubripertinctus]|uniref:TTHB210-like domain-containing protein n=1 Tax=Hymenobacter rubripertinctus TaxID=2029981 RepID=A0A418QPS2_9BACT|nr:DUF5602 domain-containing protein [Hymenobacter rubripertinctus]RIY07247.1 hypothetical protein D0T11_17045 [Hymenobacter rubripertinctus]
MKTARIFFPSTWGRALGPLPLLLPLLLASCDQKDANTPAPQPSTTNGPAVAIGAGSAHSFVTVDAAGQPTEIGFAVTEAALASLPAAGTMYDMVLPAGNAALAQMPFDHISFDWNPNGHDPLPIYGAPHFDAHFYMLPMSVQHTISLDDPKGDIFPPAAKLPTGYVTAPNVAPGRTVPMMGRHWIDPTSPEYTPGTAFTHTFIYGSYDGKVTFIEPMFTKALLVAGLNMEQPIKQPATYELTGKYFPTTYTIRQEAATREYIISLKGMMLR